MKRNNYELIQKELLNYSHANDNVDLNQFAEGIKKNFSHVEILHDAYVRSKLNKIAKHLQFIVSAIIFSNIVAFIFLAYYWIFNSWHIINKI
jgi:hypothetical protein